LRNELFRAAKGDSWFGIALSFQTHSFGSASSTVMPNRAVRQMANHWHLSEMKNDSMTMF
jgi:hypothetical protein